MDNFKTHTIGAFYEAFEPVESNENRSRSMANAQEQHGGQNKLAVYK
jgi:hypothetical protein